MKLTTEQALDLIGNELARAEKKHPLAGVTPRHSHSVIEEEFDEFWDAIKADDFEHAQTEVIHLGAMCLRYLKEHGKPGAEPIHLPRIVCAAMKMDDGQIVIGIRHFSPDMRARLARDYGNDYKYKVVEQGFIDIHGTFHNRANAHILAKANKQIVYRCGGDEAELFSENLY